MSDILCTNRDIWQALVHTSDVSKPGALAELVALDTPLPASNLLRRSLRLCQAEFPTLNEERQKLVDKYVTVEKDAEGNESQHIDPAFFAEFETLMGVPVTLAGAEVVYAKDLGRVEFSGAKLNLLTAFVQDEPVAPKKPEPVK